MNPVVLVFQPLQGLGQEVAGLADTLAEVALFRDRQARVEDVGPVFQQVDDPGTFLKGLHDLQLPVLIGANLL